MVVIVEVREPSFFLLLAQAKEQSEAMRLIRRFADNICANRLSVTSCLCSKPLEGIRSSLHLHRQTSVTSINRAQRVQYAEDVNKI